MSSSSMHPLAIPVHPLSEVRGRLSGILARFRRDGSGAEPVVFGSHRKPEAIILPYQEFEALIQQRERMFSALDVMRSVQVELPGPFSTDHERLVSAYVDGEIDADEAYRRMLAVYQPER